MKDEELRETFVSAEQIFKGYILDVQKWTVTLPDGSIAPREIILHKGASAVVPVDSDGNVYMVKQFRTPIGRVMHEIPAGKLDYIGEDRFEAAKRELKEETGFTAAKWTHLTDIATTPGFTNELISLYLAQELTAGETDFDDDEFLALEKMPLSEAVARCVSGEYQDSKTIIGLLLANTAIAAQKAGADV